MKKYVGCRMAELRVSQVAQWVKNPPATQEMQVWSLGRSPGEGHGNPLQYLFLENAKDRGTWDGLQSMGSQRVRHDWSNWAHTQGRTKGKRYTSSLYRGTNQGLAKKKREGPKVTRQESGQARLESINPNGLGANWQTPVHLQTIWAGTQ